jgi:TRAP-type C4-dicarboxylate transport system permease small subunit
MRLLLSLLAILCGLALLALTATTLMDLARVMAPFGGIPWSWELLEQNPGWAASALAGAMLLLAGCVLLLRRPHGP